MMYTVVWDWRDWDELQRVSSEAQKRILDAIDGLATDRHPSTSIALTHRRGSFRLRIGSYRVVYQVDDAEEQVTILAVGHRKDVYR